MDDGKSQTFAYVPGDFAESMKCVYDTVGSVSFNGIVPGTTFDLMKLSGCHDNRNR